MEQARPGGTQARPVAITIICVLGFVGAVLSGGLIFSDIFHRSPPWYRGFLAVSAAIGTISTVGLWLMRKWAVYTYTALVAIVQVVLLQIGLWSPQNLIMPAIMTIVMFVYLPRMR